MLKRDNSEHPRMDAQQRRQFQQAVAEEQAARAENIEVAKKSVPHLLDRCGQANAVVAQLRESREALGVSLAEMEQRTGIRKSVLSRLENSKAPNPTLATMQRYAEALGKRVAFSIEDPADRE